MLELLDAQIAYETARRAFYRDYSGEDYSHDMLLLMEQQELAHLRVRYYSAYEAWWYADRAVPKFEAVAETAPVG